MAAQAMERATEHTDSLPFPRYFTRLATPEAEATESLGIRRQPFVVDMWEIALTPAEYSARFTSVLASVELACHTTGVPSGRNGHELEFKG